MKRDEGEVVEVGWDGVGVQEKGEEGKGRCRGGRGRDQWRGNEEEGERGEGEFIERKDGGDCS